MVIGHRNKPKLHKNNMRMMKNCNNQLVKYEAANFYKK